MGRPKGILKRNVGIGWERTKRSYGDMINLEKVFMEEWNKFNGNEKWLNQGLGIAQLLMVVDRVAAEEFDGPNKDQRNMFNQNDVCVYNLTEREQRIIATIIQWLGTNVGFSFVRRCFQIAGYSINVMKKPKEEIEGNDRFWILKNCL